jgi:hypothetical protein
LSTPLSSVVRYTPEGGPVLEFVRVEPAADGQEALPPQLSSRITIDTVHDGRCIPGWVLEAPAVQELERNGRLWEHYVLERDWGASLVACHLARALGLEGFQQVNLARVVMDFNRFPGSSPARAHHLDRLAITPPLSRVLSYEHKREVLERYYDRISSGMERAMEGKLLKIAVHTYDERNPSRTRRPEVSVLTRSHSYQVHSRLPFGVFDPLFPDELVASSADAILRDRITLTVEKLGTTVEQNYPYSFPDGSIEIRAQVWLFFQYARRLFLERYPEREGRPHYQRVWEMLLNTSHRRAESEVLFGYLHRFRRPSHGAGAEMAASRRAYEAIRDFMHSEDLAQRYLTAPERVNILGIEVRKDLVWCFEDGEPVGPDEDSAKQIAHRIAQGVRAYFRHDRPDLAGGPA